MTKRKPQRKTPGDETLESPQDANHQEQDTASDFASARLKSSQQETQQTPKIPRGLAALSMMGDISRGKVDPRELFTAPGSQGKQEEQPPEQEQHNQQQEQQHKAELEQERQQQKKQGALQKMQQQYQKLQAFQEKYSPQRIAKRAKRKMEVLAQWPTRTALSKLWITLFGTTATIVGIVIAFFIYIAIFFYFIFFWAFRSKLQAPPGSEWVPGPLLEKDEGERLAQWLYQLEKIAFGILYVLIPGMVLVALIFLAVAVCLIPTEGIFLGYCRQAYWNAITSAIP